MPTFLAPYMPYYVANNPAANRLRNMILPPQPTPRSALPRAPIVETRPTTQEAAVTDGPLTTPSFASPFLPSYISPPTGLFPPRSCRNVNALRTSAELDRPVPNVESGGATREHGKNGGPPTTHPPTHPPG